MKKILKHVFILTRNYLLEDITGNIGNCVVLEDKIVCFVDGRKLKKKSDMQCIYTIFLNSIDSDRLYCTDRPIYYIIENVVFDKGVKITSSLKNCNVLFKNCTFNDVIMLDQADHIIFDNCKYLKSFNPYNNYSSSLNDGFTLSVRNKNDINYLEIANSKMDFGDNLYLRSMIVNLKNLDITGNNVILEADDLSLDNISFLFKKTIIDAKKVTLEDSNVLSEEVLIENEGVSEFNSINSVVNDCDDRKIDLESIRLGKQRLQLLDILSKIKDECTSCIDNKLSISEEKMKNQSVKRVLRK